MGGRHTERRCGIAAAVGDEQTLRLSVGAEGVLAGGTFGDGVRRALHSQGAIFPGEWLLAVGLSVPERHGGLRYGAKSPAKRRGFYSPEPDPRRGGLTQAGDRHHPGGCFGDPGQKVKLLQAAYES